MFCVVLLFNQLHFILFTSEYSLNNLLCQGLTLRGNLLNETWRMLPPMMLFTDFNY